MHERILVPVDLAHLDKLTKAIDIATLLAKTESATVIYTGVTGTEPSSVAKSPEAYEQKLQEYAQEQGRSLGISTEAHTIRSHDVSVDLSKKLIEAIKEARADLVVMASHVPGAGDHVFHSNAGNVASYAPVSVYVVR